MRLWMVDGIGTSLGEPLVRWRDDTLNDAIIARDRGDRPKWTDKYASLGVDDWAVAEANWQSALGIRRVCLVQPLLLEDEKEGEVNRSYLKGKPALDDFLPFMAESLGKVPFVHGLKTNDSPYEYRMRFHHDIVFQVWSYAGINNHDEAITCLKAMRNVWLEGRCKTCITPLRDPFFLFLLDTPERNLTVCREDALRHLYVQLCKRDIDIIDGLPELRLLPCELGVEGGLVGLEGMAVVRRIPNEPKPDFCMGGDDHFWGGSAWLAWLVTLFQCTAAEQHAIKAKTILEELNEPDDSKNAKLDNILKRISDSLKYALELEVKWMYRELAKRTELDRLYRLFQESYDIDKTWTNVREQSEMISNYAETKRAEKLCRFNMLQTQFGILMGAFLLFLSLMQIYNNENKPILREWFCSLVDRAPSVKDFCLWVEGFVPVPVMILVIIFFLAFVAMCFYRRRHENL